MVKKHKKPEDAKKESARILRQVEIDAETIGTSSFARSVEKTRDHFLGNDRNPDDPIEVWGARIGRGLSVIIVVMLVTYLYNTFFSGQ